MGSVLPLHISLHTEHMGLIGVCGGVNLSKVLPKQRDRSNPWAQLNIMAPLKIYQTKGASEIVYQIV